MLEIFLTFSQVSWVFEAHFLIKIFLIKKRVSWYSMKTNLGMLMILVFSYLAMCMKDQNFTTGTVSDTETARKILERNTF